jgi:hypothetical protein
MPSPDALAWRRIFACQFDCAVDESYITSGDLPPVARIDWGKQVGRHTGPREGLSRREAAPDGEPSGSSRRVGSGIEPGRRAVMRKASGLVSGEGFAGRGRSRAPPNGCRWIRRAVWRSGPLSKHFLSALPVLVFPYPRFARGWAVGEGLQRPRLEVSPRRFAVKLLLPLADEGEAEACV